MKEHTQNIINRLSISSQRGRVFYGLLAADRLRNCCWAAFQGVSSWHRYADVIEQVYTEVLFSKNVDGQHFNRWKVDVESLIPSGGEPLQAQAQYAFIVLLEALSLYDEVTVDGIELITDCMIGGLDNYIFYVQRHLMGDTSNPKAYPLLERELECQSADAELAARFETLSLAELQKTRANNLQFVIPPAVALQ